MLNALRKGTGTWIAKIFIALLVLSFAVWGVADIFGGYGARTLAQVGDREISGEEYQTRLRRQLTTLGARFGRSLTMEEGRALGIDRQVLQQMIGEVALDSAAAGYNLGISDEAIANAIKSEDAFKDAAGRFNDQIFRSLLYSNNLTEQGYVASQRQASLRQQLTQTLTEAVPLPKTLLAATDLYRNEKRTLQYFTLPESKLDTIEDPTDEQLRTYYDANKRNFMAPEYRKIGILPVTVASIGDRIEIDDVEIKTYYDQNKDRFTTPEKRRVLQISYPDKSAAEAARQKIESGTDFIEAAKERGFSESDIDLGLITKASLSDKVIADAAFSLAKDQVSQPVVGGLATVLLKVTEIEPAVVRTFEQVKEEIRNEILTSRATAEILDFSDKVEDERGAGTPLDEIAKKLGLDFIEVAAVDRSGNDEKGVAVTPLPGGPRVLAEVFRSEIDIDNDPVETQDRGLIWTVVLDITPERQKTFDEVKEDVSKAWREAEVRSRLAKRAQELIDKAKGGTSFDELAKGLELEVKESEPLTRTQSADDLPNTVVAQAFALSQGGYGSAPGDGGDNRIVFKVDKITAPGSLDADRTKTLQESLESARTADITSEYLTGLQANLGITINQILFDELTGRRFAENRGSF